MGNIHVLLYEIWTSGSGGDVVKKKFTDDGRRPITIPHLVPKGELKIKMLKNKYFSFL